MSRPAGNLYIEVSHQAPALYQGENPEPWWRADVIVQGVFGVDRHSLAHGFAKVDCENGVDERAAKGSAVSTAWHQLWRELEVVERD